MPAPQLVCIESTLNRYCRAIQHAREQIGLDNIVIMIPFVRTPSDYPDFAEFLVQAGVDSISLNPDSVLEVMRRVAQAEANHPVDGQ